MRAGCADDDDDDDDDGAACPVSVLRRDHVGVAAGAEGGGDPDGAGSGDEVDDIDNFGKKLSPEKEGDRLNKPRVLSIIFLKKLLLWLQRL